MRKKGFTLIELLSVIVIVGLLLIIAVPTANKIILNSKQNVFFKNLSIYINAAKTLAATSTDDFVVYNLNELTENLISPFNTKLDGKVARIASGEKYKYYIYLEDSAGRTVGKFTDNKIPVLLSEEEILTGSYSSVVKNKADLIKEADGVCNSTEEIRHICTSMIVEANPFGSKDLVLVSESETNKTYVYPRLFATEEGFKFATARTVAVRLRDKSDEKDAIVQSGIVLNAFYDEKSKKESFDILLTEDYYSPVKKGEPADRNLKVFESKIANLTRSNSSVFWPNVESVRVLSLNDINYFATILGDNGKITCNEENCKITMQYQNYRKILQALSINLIPRPESEKIQSLDTWITDDNLCYYDKNTKKFVFKNNYKELNKNFCAKVSYFEPKHIFIEKASSTANLKIIVRVNREHIL